MTTIREQVVNDVNAVFDAGLAINITHHYGASQETLKAFFDIAYQPSFEGALPVENAVPRILVKTATAGNITKNSSFTINAVTYYVSAITTDNEGVIEIFLSEDSAG